MDNNGENNWENYNQLQANVFRGKMKSFYLGLPKATIIIIMLNNILNIMRSNDKKNYIT